MSFSSALSEFFKPAGQKAEDELHDLTHAKWSSTRWLALLAFAALVLMQVRLALTPENLKLMLYAYGIYTFGNTLTQISTTIAKGMHNKEVIKATVDAPEPSTGPTTNIITK